MRDFPPRLPPLSPPYSPEIQALLTRMTPPGAPDILALFRVLAHNPLLAERMTGWGGYLLFLACTGAVFLAGAKILDCLKYEREREEAAARSS